MQEVEFQLSLPAVSDIDPATGSSRRVLNADGARAGGSSGQRYNCSEAKSLDQAMRHSCLEEGSDDWLKFKLKCAH